MVGGVGLTFLKNAHANQSRTSGKKKKEAQTNPSQKKKLSRYNRQHHHPPRGRTKAKRPERKEGRQAECSKRQFKQGNVTTQQWRSGRDLTN